MPARNDASPVPLPGMGGLHDAGPSRHAVPAPYGNDSPAPAYPLRAADTAVSGPLFR